MRSRALVVLQGTSLQARRTRVCLGSGSDAIQSARLKSIRLYRSEPLLHRRVRYEQRHCGEDEDSVQSIWFRHASVRLKPGAGPRHTAAPHRQPTASQ